MASQFKEWKVCGTSPFYVSRNGIGVGGQWHLNKRGVAASFKTKDGAERRAAELNSASLRGEA